MGLADQVVDEAATKEAQEKADEAAKSEGKDGAEPVEAVNKSEGKEVWDWRVQNDNKPLWTRSPKEARPAQHILPSHSSMHALPVQSDNKPLWRRSRTIYSSLAHPACVCLPYVVCELVRRFSAPLPSPSCCLTGPWGLIVYHSDATCRASEKESLTHAFFALGAACMRGAQAKRMRGCCSAQGRILEDEIQKRACCLQHILTSVTREHDSVLPSPVLQVGQEEYATFFKTTFREFLDPLAQSHFNVEGTIEFSALLFVPGMAPFEQQVRRACESPQARSLLAPHSCMFPTQARVL